PHHAVIDPLLAQPAVGDRQALGEAGAHRVAERPDGSGETTERHQWRERRRWKVLVRVTWREHKPGNALAVVDGDKLTERTPCVVAHKRDVLEAELRYEIRYQLRQTGRREIHPVVQGLRV